MTDALSASAESLIRGAMARAAGPVIVAIDGRSGVGKSTLAADLAERFDTTLIEGDDFYAGGVGMLGDSPKERAARCIDWQDQRRVLADLRHGRATSWFAFDWDAFDGRTAEEATVATPAQLVILEGVYSARPELADLLHLRLLLRVPEAVRLSRLLAREGEIGPWETQWHEAEDWYFANAALPEGFDLVIDG